jgi:hypothetical protein
LPGTEKLWDVPVHPVSRSAPAFGWIVTVSWLGPVELGGQELGGSVVLVVVPGLQTRTTCASSRGGLKPFDAMAVSRMTLLFFFGFFFPLSLTVNDL